MGKYIGVQTLEVLEGAENYNKWIASRIKPYLKSPTLEIGAGTGNISEHMLNLKELVLTDIDSMLIDSLTKKFAKNKNIKVELFNAASNLSKVKSRFKSIYGVNVLEHIDNDEKALRNLYGLLENSGKLVLLVPAKRIAYNELDRSLGHYRRYEKEELREKMKNAGFKVEELEFFNMAGLLSWIVRNYISKNHGQLEKSQVKSFNWVVPMLKAIEPKKGLPFGISLIVVASKK